MSAGLVLSQRTVEMEKVETVANGQYICEYTVYMYV